MAEKNVPEIRFKGFSGGWKNKKLGEFCLIGDIDHKMPPTALNGIPYLMTGDFIGTNDLDFKNAKLISVEDYEQLSKKIKPEAGDILFARYASVGEVRYVEIQRKFLISYSCAILKPNDTTSGKYLFYYMQINDFLYQIELEINTGSQRNIGIDSLKKLIILRPQMREQKGLEAFFTKLDSLITHHQQKHDKLLNLKKAMLEKMFPKKEADIPDIRFKGFSEKWEERELGELTQVIDPHPSHRAPDAVSRGVPFIGIGDISEDGEIDYSNVRIVSHHIFDEHRRRYTLNEGDFAFGRVASIGKIIDLSKNVLSKYTYSPTMALVKPISVDSSYLKGYFYTETFKNCVDNKTTGSTRKSLGVQAFRELPVFFPEEKEQTKIGNFFKNLDHLLTLHQTQLKKLKNIKKACLEKMFV